MSPTITGLNLVKYPVVIFDQRELDFDPDLSFPFTIKQTLDSGNLGYPCEADLTPSGWTDIKFTAENEPDFVNKITEYLVTCYDGADLAIWPAGTYTDTLYFVYQDPENLTLA